MRTKRFLTVLWDVFEPIVTANRLWSTIERVLIFLGLTVLGFIPPGLANLGVSWRIVLCLAILVALALRSCYRLHSKMEATDLLLAVNQPSRIKLWRSRTAHGAANESYDMDSDFTLRFENSCSLALTVTSLRLDVIFKRWWGEMPVPLEEITVCFVNGTKFDQFRDVPIPANQPSEFSVVAQHKLYGIRPGELGRNHRVRLAIEVMGRRPEQCIDWQPDWAQARLTLDSHTPSDGGSV